MTLTTCPGCGESAEVIDRFTLPGTGGPVEHIRSHCVNGDWYMAPPADTQNVD